MKTVRVVSLVRDMPTGLLFIPTKYYQNMSIDMKVWSAQGCFFRFLLQGR